MTVALTSRLQQLRLRENQLFLVADDCRSASWPGWPRCCSRVAIERTSHLFFGLAPSPPAAVPRARRW